MLAVLAWPSSTSWLGVSTVVTPSSIAEGIASSWQSALAMAVHNRLSFGTHVVFTYGPLAFLQDEQLNYQWTTVLSVVFALAFFTAVLGALVRALRRTIPLAVAVVVAYVVGAVTLRDWGFMIVEALALVLVVCVAVMSSNDDESTPLWIWVVLGGLLGLFSLVQVSLGLGIVVVLFITVASLSRRRVDAAGAIVVGAVPAFCLGWFGTGNGLGNVVPFAKGSAAIISGYTPAMGLVISGRADAGVLAAVVVVMIAVLAYDHARGLLWRSSIGIFLATMVVVWLLLKEAFVRHDTHDLVFFAAAPLVLAAFAPRRLSWALAPAMLIITGMFAFLAQGALPLAPRPDQSIAHFIDQVSTVASPGRSAAQIDQSRRSLRNAYALPKSMVAMMANHTVDISPWEQDIAWAYPQIHFDPLPVVQDYSAYTPSLDQLDANYLASSDAPRFILRQPNVAVDDRYPEFEPPEAQLAAECRYDQVSVSGQWQLLERGANRCGPLQPLGTVTTGYGRWIAVPSPKPGDAIVARFQLAQSLLSKIESLVFRPPFVFIQFNRSRQSWRFVASTGPDLHILQPASTLHYDGFMPDSLTSLQFTIAGASRDTTGVTVSFYSLTMAPEEGTTEAVNTAP